MSKKQKLDLTDFLTSPLRDEETTSIVTNLFNRFLSEEQSVRVNGQIGNKPSENVADITATDFDREQNVLVPAMYFKTGTEESLFTFDDLVNRLKAIGVDTNNLKSMLAEQSFNFAPPIALDKFVNYSNYYWIGKAEPRPTMPWNPDVDPEYYTIARPPRTSTQKQPVKLATTRDIKLWGKDRARELIRVEFLSTSTFTLTGDQGTLYARTTDTIGTETNGVQTLSTLSVGGTTTVHVLAPDINDPESNGYGRGDPSGANDELFTFVITNGGAPFAIGDYFEIDIQYGSGSSQVSFHSASVIGKGNVANIVPDTRLMYIDGVALKIGDNVLVWRQNDYSENGIYTVSQGRWTRRLGNEQTEFWPLGSLVYVLAGTQAGYTYELTAQSPSFELDSPTNGDMQFTLKSTTAPSPVNDWQAHNLWLHHDELLLRSPTVQAAAIQASRPIIEYSRDLKLNSFLSAGRPADSGIEYTQRKTRFNQLPQFDLYRHDGTHAARTSSIFYYVEDPDYPIDVSLQKRVKTTSNSDYIFGLGVFDALGRTLFFKLGTTVTSIWKAGPASASISTIKFTSTPPLSSLNKGTIGVVPAINADTQTWTVKALTSSTFSVHGSRSGDVGVATVGSPFSVNGELQLTLTAGVNSFDVGDTFSFDMRGPVGPRYVTKDADGNLINFPGGPAADTNEEGVWLTPRRMFENMPRVMDPQITFGDLIDHSRSIIKAQNGFEGSSFGINNYRLLNANVGLGGLIREYDSNFQLLASLLIQKDLSPLTILEFAESQYLKALSSVDQFLIDELAKYISVGAAMTMTSINTTNPQLVALLEYFEKLRSENQTLKSMFSDTTAKIANWPISLPMMGMAPVVVPTFTFDNELGINALVHHDGHISPMAVKNADFERSVAQTVILRSDGTESAGVVGTSAPANPYARQFWFNPTTNVLYTFEVAGDTDIAPPGAINTFWYRRSDGKLFEWDGGAWAASLAPPSSRWKIVDTAIIRNSLMLAIEQKLYLSVHPSMVQKVNLATNASNPAAAIELAKYAAKYGYDTFAPDYNATDAFTWNYAQATIPGVPAGTARWHAVIKAYFNQPGISLPTSRPNIEPWKLLNYATKADASAGLGYDWDTAYADVTNTRLWNNTMWAYIQAQRPTMKLSVNTLTDALLPPYVNAVAAMAGNALTNTMPSGISDVYAFGQDGPVESIWKKSLEYRYGLARVAFKVAPLQFIDKTWGETYFTSAAGVLRIERNLLTPLAPAKFLLHGEKLHNINQKAAALNLQVGTMNVGSDDVVKLVVSHVEDNRTFLNVTVNDALIGTIEEGVAFGFSASNTTFTGVVLNDRGIPFSMDDTFTITATAKTFTPANSKKLIGLGQMYTNLLRYNTVDTSDLSETMNAYRGWDMRLVHRIGALIRSDSLKISAAGLAVLPDTAYSVVMKRATSTQSKWISAIRVQLVQAGSYVLSGGGDGINVPLGDASDWVFRVETYNPQHPLAERYVLDNTSDFTTFHALNKGNTDLAFKRYVERSSLVESTMPVTITGLQNTLDFIFGYIDRLDELGWKMNAGERVITDAQTGRNLDWQLEVEKFVDHVYGGMLPGQGHILNPFMEGLWLETPVGLMSRYTERNFMDVASTQAAFDVVGATIPLSSLQVIRTDERTVTYSDIPVFSAHAFIDQFEHVILFNNRISDELDSTTLFNPFLGLRVATANLTYVRQAEVDRKPRFNGFVFVGNELKRNITSSVDAMANYYDATKTFAEPTTSKHALALLGFNKKDYFEELGTSDATQFNFWRGLIQAKGTNMTVDAYVNYKKFTSAGVDEYWAYKLAEYGDGLTRVFPEIKIEVTDALQSFTQLQFYDANDTEYQPLPLFTQIEQDDDTRWYTIDDLGAGVKFPADAMEAVIENTAVGYYKLSDIFHNGDGGAPKIYLRTVVRDGSGGVVSSVDTLATTAKMVNASLVRVFSQLTPPAFTTYSYVVKGYTWRNFSKLSPVKLFNYRDAVKIKDIALWHPALGIHAYEPLDVINTIGSVDSALYNTSIKTVDNPNYVFTKPWGKREVGRVWWNTSNLGYIPYYDATIFPDRSERNARWGNLADWASVDIYEWVESDVAPEDYDALALEQEGQSDIHPSIKASGRAALKKFYSRDRVISTRPIAWSRAGVGASVAHPSFTASSQSIILASGALFVDAGTAEASGLTVGRRFGAFKNLKPYGELLIGADLVHNIGSSLVLSEPQIAEAPFRSVTVSAIPNGRIGEVLGEISLTSRLIQLGASSYSQRLRMSSTNGIVQDVVIEDWLEDSDNEIVYAFDDFGIQLKVVRMSNTFMSASNDIVPALTAGWQDVYIREGVRYDTVIPLPTGESKFVNDITALDFNDYDYGWQAWDIPTQAQLDADLPYPRNVWHPYMGDKSSVDASPSVIEEMQDDGLMLKSGVLIKRFDSSWTNWVELSDIRLEKISNGVDSISFARVNFLTDDEVFDQKRISVYSNGLQISPKNYTITGDTGAEVITVVGTLTEGTKILFVYRAKQLTAEDLAFDSEVEDDPSKLVEYKASYQYTKIDTRNESGAITGAKYYFWVQDSTVVRPGKSVSLQRAKAVLTSGPTQYVTFAKLDERTECFDSCVIAGLNVYVTNNDTYKLRFVHNETLRDDPEQLSLRNVHTEWALIKKGQNSKIPESLWEHLTDAAAGQDAGGNPLPAPARVDYDARNGTRSSYGFGQGQIFAATDLVRSTIQNTILNTSLEIRIGGTTIPDTITALNFDESDSWFADAASARATMELIWFTARPRQINEIFFDVLEDALANNYEFSDIFKTSLISVQTTSVIDSQVEGELEDGQF